MVTVPTQEPYRASPESLGHARRVFLAGNGLPSRWRGRRAFTILQTGFGAGVDFLAAWDAWRGDPAAPGRLHFIAAEDRPLARDDLAAALVPLEELGPLARALASVWPEPLAGYHRMHFDAGRVALTLLLGEMRASLAGLEARADAFFLDAFAPTPRRDAWSPESVRELARLAAPGASLAGGTVAPGAQAALASVGFAVDRRTAEGGAPMLAGSWPGTSADAAATRHALVIGAGLAGTMVAERLAARDWEVDLLDARPRSLPAVGLLRPVANLRDALNAHASRSAYLYALQHFRALQYDGYHLQWERGGILQLAGDDDEAARLAAIAGSQGYPPSFLRFVDAAEATAVAGRPVRGPGWHFPSGAWVSPESLAVASLARAGERVRKALGAVARVAHEPSGWTAYGAGGEVLGRAAHLVLANAAEAARLLPEARLTLSSVRGQVTYVPEAAGRALALPVSGSGYVAPHPGGGHVIGASFQHDDADDGVRAADHRENLARAESMLPGFTAGLHPMALQGWTGFRTTVPDRLPVFGATALPGAWAATGLGSRGLLWGPLGAELLACAASGEPLPLPRHLAGAISPLRFLS